MTTTTEKITSLSDARKGWEKLIASPEWGQLIAILQGQVDAFQREILFVPLRSLEDALPQEYKKGQVEGRLSISNTVETIIEGLNIELNSLRNDDGTE